MSSNPFRMLELWGGPRSGGMPGSSQEAVLLHLRMAGQYGGVVPEAFLQAEVRLCPGPDRVFLHGPLVVWIAIPFRAAAHCPFSFRIFTLFRIIRQLLEFRNAEFAGSSPLHPTGTDSFPLPDHFEYRNDRRAL